MYPLMIPGSWIFNQLATATFDRMIPLDSFVKWSTQLDECARQYLDGSEYDEYESIPLHQRLRQLKAILEKPIFHFSSVNEAYFRAKWADVLRAARPGKDFALLEVASGDADMIPQMMARIYPHSRYISANMNQILSHRLRVKTKDLPVEVVVIEEDAAKIEKYLPSKSIDIIAFQHGVNDVIQAILCDREEVDTVHTDWMDMLPKMISILQKEIAQNTLEQHAKPAFLSMLESLFKVLKTNGVIVMSHYMFQLDLDWGYPPDLWEYLIPLTREWLKELPQCKELLFEGFDPHWWLFTRLGGPAG